MNKSIFRSGVSLVALIFSFLTPISVEAATRHVNVTTDDGTGMCTATRCTLRDAILSAASGDEIAFSLPANSTIALTNGALLIDGSLVINGPGPNSLTIARSTAAGTADFRILDIPSAGGSVVLAGLTIANGIDHSTDGGGAIHNLGFVSLTNCVVSGSVGTQIAGGISNRGTLIIEGSTIAGNSGPAAGGIFNMGNGVLQITNSTISGNSNDRGSGGGILNFDTATLTISNSTISGNTGALGGGIFNNSTVAVTIANSTISGNTSPGTNGEAGGILNTASGTVRLRSTIVAKNTSILSPDIGSGGTVTSQGYNLIGNNQGAGMNATTGDQIGTPAVPIDPLLGPLQDNGGPTKTQALLSGSRAIDKGDSGGSVADQRGFTRPVDTPLITNSGDGSDVGAYEVQADQLAGCSEINLVVDNLSDSGARSLRSVITSACSGSTITFSPNARGAITLTSGELVLDKILTINGPGANLLSVQRSTAAGTPNFRIFHIPGNVRAAISGLTIANGNLPGSLGAGISNDNGTLTLANVTISGNTADVGAGLYTARAATITSSTISGNTASGNLAGTGGAGIYNGGTLALNNSTISGNVAQATGGGDRGGGILNNLGTVTIIDSTIAGNTADAGGGCMNTNNGTMRSRNTIIALNTSPSGPDFNGTLVSMGFTLLGTNAQTSIMQTGYDQIGTPAAMVDPLLGPLQDNGGPTFTRALRTGSPAIDKGGANSPMDQRGFPRPYDDPNIINPIPGDGSDIGAFEVQAPPTTLANISTRLRVDTGDNVLIGGFIVTGTQPKRVILRAIGPSLTAAGVPGALANPILELHDSSQVIASNDNWMDAPNRQEIIDSTLAPTNDLESAILITLPANNSAYTAIVKGVNDGVGVGLVEAYDLDRTVDSKLANISTRGSVQTGESVMIGGFIVAGQTPQRVIVRAIGPSLPVAGKLADPILELHDSNGALLQSNDNWMDAPNRQEIIDSTLAPTDDLESAILMTLPANNSAYTAIVRGVNSATGVGLVEVYALN